VTTPSGLLAWGQAGQYDANDDRAVITALANQRNGVVSQCAMGAGTGLMIHIYAGWLAVADCGDSTIGVIGSRVPLDVPVPAGPPTGTQTWYIWADVNPDAATFTISAIAPADADGRSGVQLGTVTAHAGDNSASQMSISSAQPSFDNVSGLTIATPSTGGTAFIEATKQGMLYVASRTTSNASGILVCSLQDGTHRTAQTAPDGVSITPKWSVPLADLTAWGHYKLHTSGQGHAPNPVTGFFFDVNFQGAGYARVNFSSGALATGAAFNFWIDAHAQIDQLAHNIYLAIKVDVTTATGVMFSGVATMPNLPLPAGNSYLNIRTDLGQHPGASAETWSSVLQRFGGADPAGQIIP
jgi:hypothetical protein